MKTIALYRSTDGTIHRGQLLEQRDNYVLVLGQYKWKKFIARKFLLATFQENQQQKGKGRVRNS